MNNKGFTLIIELLVVIAIIGILSSVVLTSLEPDYKKKINKKEACQKEKTDCRFACTEEDEKDAMDMCLEKCEIKSEQCNL